MFAVRQNVHCETHMPAVRHKCLLGERNNHCETHMFAARQKCSLCDINVSVGRKGLQLDTNVSSTVRHTCLLLDKIDYCLKYLL